MVGAACGARTCRVSFREGQNAHEVCCNPKESRCICAPEVIVNSERLTPPPSQGGDVQQHPPCIGKVPWIERGATPPPARLEGPREEWVARRPIDAQNAGHVSPEPFASSPALSAVSRMCSCSLPCGTSRAGRISRNKAPMCTELISRRRHHSTAPKRLRAFVEPSMRNQKRDDWSSLRQGAAGRVTTAVCGPRSTFSTKRCQAVGTACLSTPHTSTATA